MNRSYEIEVKDTPFHTEKGIERYLVKRSDGMDDRYEVRIYLAGPDVRYVSSATYWSPGSLEFPYRGLDHELIPTYRLMQMRLPIALDFRRTVERTWRNTDCSLKIWTNKVHVVPVEIELKNGQVIVVHHTLTYSNAFSARVHIPGDVMIHDDGTLSYGVEKLENGYGANRLADEDEISHEHVGRSEVH